MTFSSYILLISCLGVIFLTEHCESLDLPPNIDNVGYCEICKKTALTLYELVNGKKMTLYDAWGKLCDAKYFSSLTNKYKINDLVRGCQHLQQPGNDNYYEMYEMLRQLIEHNATSQELKTSMCYMTSEACKERRKISDVDKQPELSLEELQKYLESGPVKKPDPIRMQDKSRPDEMNEKSEPVARMQDEL